MSAPCSHIMLVENNTVLAEITSFRLELLGYRVTVMATAEQALTALADQTPDALIIDLTLPGVTGLELIEQVTREQRTSEIPIMALSLEGELDLVAQAHRAGAQDYLVAPYNPLVLEEKISRLVTSSNAARARDPEKGRPKKRTPLTTRN